VATRYINRIDIPYQQTERVASSDYVKVEPRLIEGLSEIVAFNTQFIGVVPAINGNVVVNAGTAEAPLIDHVSFVLDIDLYKDKELPGKEEEIWKLMDTFREQKDALFEAFITDRARELFDRV
jgi:uncharacterized protein (TIGR04255 family)